jgi:hypothetical protein
VLDTITVLNAARTRSTAITCALIDVLPSMIRTPH